jgi:NAD(P)-dependent dehydrogenase (short-subunit alcohol dehydrogenase family)
MYLEKFKLGGKTAIITGAGQGIGLACAEALAEAGAKVVMADRDAKVAAQGHAALKAKGYDAETVILDVTDSAAVSKTADQLTARYGKVDILVNNAGIARSETPAEAVTDEHWLNVIDVNLNGTFWCCRAFGKHMLAAKSGAIVNIGSMSGQQAAGTGLLQCVKGGGASSDQVAGGGVGRAGRARQCGGADLCGNAIERLRQEQSADVRRLDRRHTDGAAGAGR